MEKSFLTFSPKALSRKKTSKLTSSCKLKLIKPKALPLQEVGSSSNWKNMRKNDNSCDKAFKDKSVIILDDSFSPHKSFEDENTNISKQKSPFSKSCELDFNRPSNSLHQKHNTILLNESSSSKEVHKYNSSKCSSNESYDKIKQWLDQLHDVHQQKMYDPLYSTSRSVAESGSGNSSTSNNSFKLKVSETDSEDSFERIPSSTPVFRPNESNNQLHRECNLSHTSKEDSLKLRISETSSDSSVVFLSSKLHKEKNALKRVCKKLSISGSSEDSTKYACKENPVSNKGSDYSKSPPSSASSSSSNLSSGQKSSDFVFEEREGTASRLCDEIVRAQSTDTDSKSSTDRILTELYSQALDITTVKTPKIREKTLSSNLKQVSSKTNGSVDELITQLYGNTWCKESVLTPVVKRKKRLAIKRDKENTPPVNGQVLSTKSKIPDKSNFVSPDSANCNTRKVKFATGNKNLHKNTEKTLSFLESLSASPSSDVCNPRALQFKKDFKKKKDSLACELFQLFNSQVFDNKLPSNLKIEWNIRMTRTAGFCCNSWSVQPQGKVRTSRIKLSTKVLTTPDRLRDTLIHELCHAATWVIDGVKIGHGAEWKTWTRKAMQKFPELPKIKVCHSYSIETKFVYKCKSCGYSIGRHSKSLDLQRKRCGYCYGEFELLLNDKTSKAKTGDPPTPRTPRAATGFALYVKEHYKMVKEKNASLKHSDIMKVLGNQFAAMKVDTRV